MLTDKIASKEAVTMVLLDGNGNVVGSQPYDGTIPDGFVRAKGEVQFELFDKDGNAQDTQSLNLVVAVGLAFITNRMLGVASAVMSHMGVGTGTVAAAGANTQLGTQLVRVALTSTTRVTTTVANDAIQFVATFGPTVGTGAVTEAGLFNAASAGEMLARTVFPVINKGVDDTLTITWKITLS
jgi:hypothetical protein